MSLPVILAAAVPLSIVLLILNVWWDRRWKLQNVPSPAEGSTLVWGHEKTEFQDNQGWQWRAWFKECGKVFKIKGAFGHPDILVVGDTVALSHIYAKNTYNYAHSPVFRPLIERLTGRGLIWVEGEKAHRRMRGLVAPAFSADNVRGMAQDIYHVTGLFQNKIANAIHASKNGETTINAIEWTAPVTMDIIGRVGFGHDFNSIGENPEAMKIVDAWRLQNQMGTTEAGFIAMLVLRLFPWITSLPLEAIKAQGAVADHIRGLAKDIVANGQIEKGGRDLMSLLLKANARNEKDKHASLAEIYDHIVTFVVAGHETTSGALAWTLWSLACNQDIQDKLREELNSFAGEPGYDDFANPDTFPYLDAVTKEALRMFPASARNEKVAEEDDVIPLRHPIKGADGSWIKAIPVKKGQVIHIPSIGINRDEDVWGDADVFRPTRWLVNRKDAVSEKYCTAGEQGLLPADEMCGGWAGIFTFSEGPRACVGMRLALFEYKVILSTLVKSFQFHDTGAPISTRFGATLAPLVTGREQEGINLPVRITLV